MRDDAPAIVRDREFGRAAPSLGWVPAPRYLLRRDVVLRRAAAVAPGLALEIGCGAGALLADLHDLGFRCEAVETSDDARALATRLLTDLPDVHIHSEFSPMWSNRFDFLVALEVLEHIEDDAAALRQWGSVVRPGGRLLLSVPAHARQWSATDVWAGHFRRYDRADFIALAERSGLRVVRCENYGYPLGNVAHAVKAVVARGELSGQAHDECAAFRASRTAGSGVSRDVETRLFPLLSSPPGRLLMRAAARAQRWFADSELGNGFVLEAVKP